jgi:DNA-binding NtrC family response regulator
MSARLPPILVVDDEKNMCLSLQSLLGAEGYEARLVESAEEGLRWLERDRFFMVITDVHLGGMNGMDFMVKVR